MFKIDDEPLSTNEGGVFNMYDEPISQHEGACLRYRTNRNHQTREPV